MAALAAFPRSARADAGTLEASFDRVLLADLLPDLLPGLLPGLQIDAAALGLRAQAGIPVYRST